MLSIDFVPLTKINRRSQENPCFDALEQIILAGDGGWFHVLEGGSAELIAGQSIHFLPGTVVEQGGYLLARIAQHADDYCGIPVAVELKDELTRLKEQVQQTELHVECGKAPASRLYPNPTRGDFTIELDPPALYDMTIIEVYSVHGKLIKRISLKDTHIQTFSLKGHRPGVYIINVISGDYKRAHRLIKQ